MMKSIDINAFTTVFTNADLENLPKEALATLQNLRPVNGKLEKTFGLGIKLDAASYNTLDNIVTFINDNLTGEKLYVGVYVNPASAYQAVLMGWSGSAWVSLGTLSDFDAPGTYYHREDTNPIILHNDILRVLPGNVGEMGGNEAKGIWLGYIDRSFFDGIYTPTAKFYDYPTGLETPNITVTPDQHYGGGFNQNGEGEVRHYRISYRYDGNQESLLSDPVTVNYAQSRFVEMAFSITKSSFNKRITGMNVYRSYGDSTLDDPDGAYHLIHTIDFTREADESDSSASGAYWGGKRCYIPGASTINFDGTTHSIMLGDETWYDIWPTISGTGNTQFGFGTSLTENHWNDSWTIKRLSDGYEWSGTSGAYGGTDTVIINKDLGSYNYSGGVFDSSGDPVVILDNYKYALNLSHAYTWNNTSWTALSPLEGLYTVSDNSTEVDYKFYDTGLSDKDEGPPHFGEVSLKVNGAFAKMINRRLWQGNIVMDPGTTNEAHVNWLSYSGLDQPDSNPVSNVIPIDDDYGGPITGLAEVFGNPVVMKEHNLISILGTKNYPEDPSRWAKRNASHSVGNIAVNGAIEHKDSLYVIYHDGIYRFRPNNLAESDSTPSELLKISGPIEDQFLSLTPTQKKAVVSGYDPLKEELYFVLGSTVWAFNVATEFWREIDTDVVPAFMSRDEYANLLAYNSTDDKVYSAAEAETSGIKLKTKTFDISGEDNRKEILRRLKVTYKSVSALTLNIYAENAAAVAKELTLPAQTTLATYKLSPRYRVKKFALEVVDAVESTTETEIHRIEAYHD